MLRARKGFTNPPATHQSPKPQLSDLHNTPGIATSATSVLVGGRTDVGTRHSPPVGGT
jgi:hypothetical protein